MEVGRRIESLVFSGHAVRQTFARDFTTDDVKRPRVAELVPHGIIKLENGSTGGQRNGGSGYWAVRPAAMTATGLPAKESMFQRYRPEVHLRPFERYI